MKRKGVEILDYFFILRPILFYPIWTFFLAGYWGGGYFVNNTVQFKHPMGAFWIVSALTLIMGGVFILNQIQDVETDRVNGKLFIVAQGIISRRCAIWEVAALIIIGLSMGFWVDLQVGIGFLILLILSGWLYNFPPVKWKNHPIMGIVVNGMGGVLIYWLGWITGGGGATIQWRVVVYAMAGMAVFLSTTLPDIEGDKKTGKITFGVKYGIATTAVFAFFLEAGAVVLSFICEDWLLFVPAVLVFPLFVIGVFKRTISNMIRATKFSVLALAAALCVVFPWFLLPIFIVFFLSKWYYRKRFNLNYPNFKNE